MSAFVLALALTLGAGLATSIGGAIAVLPRWRDQPWVLPLGLGFSAGVMLYVSFIEIFPLAQEYLTSAWGRDRAAWSTVGAFFAGMLLIGVIDRVVPHDLNPHEYTEHDGAEAARARALLRTGTLTALAIGIHNFPEGFATFLTALESPQVALPVAVAIAIHNIPEGMAVAVPVLHATRDRARALRWATLSGMAEPLGAVVGYLALRPFISDGVLGLALAAVAGIMVFISLDELLPTAEEYGQHHITVYGLVAGMAVMAVSLLLLA